MKWVRCPSCRSFNDVDRYFMCDGCNRDLTGIAAAPLPPARPNPLPQPDTTSSHRMLWVISALLLIGTATLPIGPAVAAFFVGFVFFVAIFAKFGIKKVLETNVGTLLKVVGILFAIAVSVFGASLLVGIACAVNLSTSRY